MRSDATPIRLAAALAALAALLVAAPAAAVEALVGPAVGSADALRADGNRLYNRRQFAEAAEKYLLATRAAPDAIDAYLQLARSRLEARQVAAACYAYRVYVRNAPEGEERSKAQRELDLCERRSRAAKLGTEEKTRAFVERKAAFYGALEAGRLVGPEGAAETLTTLVQAGYLGPDLGEMAQQLTRAALAAAEDVHARALRREVMAPEELRRGADCYEAAATFGPKPAGYDARHAFLEGAFGLRSATRLPGKAADGAGDDTPAVGFRTAIERFATAAQAAPDQKEYRFFRALAIWRSGDRQGALDALRRDLPGDPRTEVAGAILALESGGGGAFALEKVLFSTRFPADR